MIYSVLITFITNTDYVLCFCFSLSFLLEFNLYSWWNIDLSVKGNRNFVMIYRHLRSERGRIFGKCEWQKENLFCLMLIL